MVQLYHYHPPPQQVTNTVKKYGSGRSGKPAAVSGLYRGYCRVPRHSGIEALLHRTFWLLYHFLSQKKGNLP